MTDIPRDYLYVLAGILIGAGLALLTAGALMTERKLEFDACKDFGAIGDSEADDTAAIQDAINAAFMPHYERTPRTWLYVMAGIFIVAGLALLTEG